MNRAASLSVLRLMKTTRCLFPLHGGRGEVRVSTSTLCGVHSSNASRT